MAIEHGALDRTFRYNSVDLPDPGAQFNPEQVRDFYSTTYPEITSAAIEGPEQKDGKLLYTFKRAVGTKGWKNGEARTAAWRERWLKRFKRDNDAMVSILLLVDLEPPVSDVEVASWTDEQCLLAEDWAARVHLRASDNNNRVPAVPPHLEPYRRRYPQRPAREVAEAVVCAMQDDNCVCFHPTLSQWQRLEAGVAKMQKDGRFFTEAEIQLFGAGEHGELLSHFERHNGFELAQQVLIEIFEED